MSRYSSHLIELSDEWAVAITICANAETLGINDSTAEGLTEAESLGLVLQAADQACARAVDASPDRESLFGCWNGGRCSRASYRNWGVAASAYRRDTEECEWIWAPPQDVPAEISKQINDALDAISSAILSAIDSLRADKPE